MYRIILVSGTLLMLTGCAPTRIVKPLNYGQQVVGLNVGGPLIEYSGATIPIPLSSLYYSRGVTDNITAFGSLHTTSLLFGVIQTDIGICGNIYQNPALRMGVSASPVLNLAIDKWKQNSRAWPELDINCYWHPAKSSNSFIYAGINNWFEVNKYRAHGEEQPRHWFPNPHIGVNYGRKNWAIVLEGKYLAPSTSSLPNVVEYRGINDQGALGIYLSINRTLK